MKPTFDPIKFEVIRNALIEATEEMTIALRRSAYSTNIKTRADFSCAFFDSELQPVAQSFTPARSSRFVVSVRAAGYPGIWTGEFGSGRCDSL